MLRPLLAFLTLCLAAFLLAPTVASVHERVEDLNVDREFPWQLWKWGEKFDPVSPFTGCSKKDRHLYSEVTEWPKRIQKDETFVVRGVVQSEEDGRLGVAQIDVDLFLNESKTEPGVFLGEATSVDGGSFTLPTSLPFDLQASRYHLVAHAKEKRIDCWTYFEHWSDPELEVVSKTTIVWQDPGRLIVGRNATLGGRLLDAVDAPVRNATVHFTLDGKTTQMQTDAEGVFVLPLRPERAGDLEVTAEYKGSKFYDGTRSTHSYDVAEEDVEVFSDGVLLRATPTGYSGQVFVGEDVQKPEAELRFEGFRVTPCEGCSPVENLTVPLDAEGRFSVTLTVPSTEPAGDHKIAIAGGGLKEVHEENATVEIPARLVLDASGVGLFSKDYEGRLQLTDEAGRPIAAPVRILTAEGERTNATDSEGVHVFTGSFAECGSFPVRAFYDGGKHIRAAEASTDVLSCGFLAFVPPWLLGAPWWLWPLALLAGIVAWQTLRAWRYRYAPLIAGGPALTLTLTEPRDEALGYAGIGEAVVATAFLEEALPDAHRLRMGAHRSTSEVTLDGDLRAHLRLVPEKLGDISIRAEIVDARGRIASRRTVTIHVVKYAEEIEKRYLWLRKASGANETVTPREFERWLHARAPGLDPALSRRLVQVFEEADYSPRVAGRAEFAAYLAAEGGVTEVSPDALA